MAATKKLTILSAPLAVLAAPAPAFAHPFHALRALAGSAAHAFGVWGLIAGTALLVAVGVGLAAALKRVRIRDLTRAASPA